MTFNGVICPVCKCDITDENTRTCELSRVMREDQSATFRAEPFRATPEQPYCPECGVSDGGHHHAFCGIVHQTCPDCGGENPDCRHNTSTACRYGCNGLTAVNTGFTEGQWRKLLSEFVALNEQKPAILRTIRGYCLEWGHVYHDGKFINDLNAKKQFRFEPGCFDHSIANNRNLKLTRDLDGTTVYASVADGTLRLTSDETGLLVEADLLDTPQNRELCDLIERGKVRGWSHSSSVMFSQSTTTKTGDATLRSFTSAPLGEITLVIEKFPRARTRQTPIFLEGGPQAKECANVLQ